MKAFLSNLLTLVAGLAPLILLVGFLYWRGVLDYVQLRYPGIYQRIGGHGPFDHERPLSRRFDPELVRFAFSGQYQEHGEDLVVRFRRGMAFVWTLAGILGVGLVASLLLLVLVLL